jgi:hypothetical protein
MRARCGSRLVRASGCSLLDNSCNCAVAAAAAAAAALLCMLKGSHLAAAGAVAGVAAALYYTRPSCGSRLPLRTALIHTRRTHKSVYIRAEILAYIQ